ncbi:MAG: flagellar basal body P-ring formation protein FlgA [Deltaproteobacteria bacterium]|jgi:flagella basal body P-ring formation protein FlgA|nr:flagellar basal body P-ring formation protein FlgA [Deltaproteobacteria bacterium]
MILPFTTLLLAAPTPPIVAGTPELAIRAVLVEAHEERAPELSAATFLGLPRPGPGVEFEAQLLPSAAADRVAVQVQVKAKGQLVARRAYELPLLAGISVVVPVRTISAGRKIEAADLTLKSLRLGGPPGRFASTLDELVGKTARVTLLADRPIPLPELRAEKIVSRGEELRVLVHTGALQVTVFAEALEDGALGERIKVRNRTSQRVFAATVSGQRQAEVEAP